VYLVFDVNKAIAAREPLFAHAQAALDTQVLKDSNLFAPKASNYLRYSGRIDEPGHISWTMSYARYQYYLGTGMFARIKAAFTGRGVHYTTPGTRAKWFEWAKALYRKQWEQIAQAAFK
jgi:hypothetical protein